MRRLVGLIALLVLILGAAWLARIDFDLTRIAEFDTLFEPASEGEAGKEVAVAPATEPAAPEASQAETEAAALQGGEKAEAPSGEAAEARAATEPRSSESGSVEPSASAAMPPESSASEMAETAAAEPAAPEAEVAPPSSAESETAMTGPAAADGAEPSGIVPSFDIVRVEPTGETVIAGIAEPEATVEILNGPEPVASAEANERGEWALVLEMPLPPGTNDLGIRTMSPDRSRVTLSDQRVAVSVPESVGEAPLVVLNQPDAPSRIMQLPAGAETAAGADVASETQAEAMAGPSASGETEMASAAQPTETPPSSGEASMATSSSEAASPTVSMAPPAPETKAASASEPKPMGEPSMSSDAPQTPAAAPVAETASGTAEARPQTGATTETNVAASPMPAPTATDAEQSAVRPPELGGETAAAASDSAAAGTMAAAMGGTTSGPSAADTSSATEMAATPPTSSEASAAPETAAGETSTAAGPEAKSPTVAEAPPPPTPKVGVAAVEAETNGALYIAGTATTPEPVRVYVDNEFLGEAEPTESGTWLLETNRELAPDEYTIRADQIDAGSGTVVARAEVPFAREIEVATLKPVGESAAAGTSEASGAVSAPMTVIIKRGDNLWRISREMYGRGIRYSTIYQANRDQIRSPHRIYPGQVFVLPAGDTSWESQ